MDWWWVGKFFLSITDQAGDVQIDIPKQGGLSPRSKFTRTRIPILFPAAREINLCWTPLSCRRRVQTQVQVQMQASRWGRKMEVEWRWSELFTCSSNT